MKLISCNMKIVSRKLGKYNVNMKNISCKLDVPLHDLDTRLAVDICLIHSIKPNEFSCRIDTS